MLARSPVLGSIWESFVYAELRKLLAAHAPEWSIWFYRDQQGREADFILQGGAGFLCMECKWTELPTPSDGKWLRDVSDLLRAAVPTPLHVERWIVARPSSSYPLADGSRAVHGAGLADELFAKAPAGIP